MPQTAFPAPRKKTRRLVLQPARAEQAPFALDRGRRTGGLKASFEIFPPISLLIGASLFLARPKSLAPAPIFGSARCNKPIMEANLYYAQAGLYGLFDLRFHVLSLLKYAFLHRFAVGLGCPRSF